MLVSVQDSLQHLARGLMIWKVNEKEVNIFAVLFIVEPAADVADNLQHEITELQSKHELKRKVQNPPSAWVVYFLRIFPLWVCSFGTTDQCEHSFFFLKPTLVKTQFHSKLTDLKLKIQIIDGSFQLDHHCYPTSDA